MFKRFYFYISALVFLFAIDITAQTAPVTNICQFPYSNIHKIVTDSFGMYVITSLNNDNFKVEKADLQNNALTPLYNYTTNLPGYIFLNNKQQIYKDKFLRVHLGNVPVGQSSTGEYNVLVFAGNGNSIDTIIRFSVPNVYGMAIGMPFITSMSEHEAMFIVSNRLYKTDYTRQGTTLVYQTDTIPNAITAVIKSGNKFFFTENRSPILPSDASVFFNKYENGIITRIDSSNIGLTTIGYYSKFLYIKYSHLPNNLNVNTKLMALTASDNPQLLYLGYGNTYTPAFSNYLGVIDSLVIFCDNNSRLVSYNLNTDTIHFVTYYKPNLLVWFPVISGTAYPLLCRVFNKRLYFLGPDTVINVNYSGNNNLWSTDGITDSFINHKVSSMLNQYYSMESMLSNLGYCGGNLWSETDTDINGEKELFSFSKFGGGLNSYNLNPYNTGDIALGSSSPGNFVNINGILYFSYQVAQSISNKTTVIAKIACQDVGIETNIIEKNFWSTFPNPNNGSFTIKFSDNISNENITVTVRDILGRLIYQDNFISTATKKINLQNNLASGIYLLELKQKNNIIGIKKISITN